MARYVQGPVTFDIEPEMDLISAASTMPRRRVTMTDKKMPAFRIIFRTRDKQKFDCATVWPKFPDSYDISPVLEWSEASIRRWR